MTPHDKTGAHVADRAAQGNRSTLLSQAVRVGCKVLSVLALARLLTPADHGLYAMGASVFLFLFIFRDFGLGAALVQAPTLNATHLTTLFWANTLLGALFMGVMLGAAPLVMRFYASPAAGPLLAVMSTAFLCIGLGSVPRTLLSRELRFRELNLVETAAAVIGTAAMITAAAAGAGAYAFVIYLLVSETLITVFAWRVCGWRPQGHPDWRSLGAIARTGQDLTRFQALNYVLTQIDLFAVGHLLGAQVLGLYSRAGQLLALTNLHVAGPLTQVALSTLSRLGNNAAEFRRQARAGTTMIAHLVLPPLSVCFALPDEVVRLALGSQWPQAAPILRWLAVSMGIITATSLSYSINLAAEQSRRLALSAVVALPFTLAAVWLGLPHGAAGMAAALAAANLALVAPRLWWVLRGSPLSVADFLGALAGPLAVAGALAAGLAAGRAGALQASGSLPLRLVAASAGGAATVALLAGAWPRVRAEWREVRTHLPFAGEVRIPPSV